MEVNDGNEAENMQKIEKLNNPKVMNLSWRKVYEKQWNFKSLAIKIPFFFF